MTTAKNLIVIESLKVGEMPRKLSDEYLKAETKPAKKAKATPQFKIEETPRGLFVTVRKNSQLAGLLANAVGYVIGHSYSRNSQGSYPLDLLVARRDRLHDYLSDGETLKEPLKSFFAMLDEEKKRIIAYMEERFAKGIAKLDDLPHYFSKGSEIIVGSGDNAYGGIVQSAYVRQSFFGSYLVVELLAIIPTSDLFGKHVITAKLAGFEDTMPLAKMSIRKITDAEKEQLSARGAIFRSFANGPRHAAYTGTLAQPSWGGERLFRSDGRIMIDAKAFKQADPNKFSSCEFDTEGVDNDLIDTDDNEAEGISSQKTISDADLWLCSNILFGFSFSAKQWGKFTVSGLREIEWRDDAFDKLVLPAEDKEVIHALVKHNAGAFADIIDGKGGGTIFLLHGRPGQGKTLLAETTAEVLHRPLYTISVGELGVSPDDLEERLRTILDLATQWNAVLLLDEADIFLEARDEHDIMRNAMVGVFLRLLEYQSSCIFLTTNRVKNIDEAFYSRIAVALQFDDADEDKLASIWENLLGAAGLARLGCSRAFAQEFPKLNGRQIKNAIRLAQTLSTSRGEDVTEDHLRRTVNLGTKFITNFNDGGPLAA